MSVLDNGNYVLDFSGDCEHTGKKAAVPGTMNQQSSWGVGHPQNLTGLLWEWSHM